MKIKANVQGFVLYITTDTIVFLTSNDTFNISYGYSCTKGQKNNNNKTKKTKNRQNQLNHFRHFEYVMDMKIFTLTEL